VTAAELVAAFWKHGEEHYRHPDGRPTGELACFRAALRPLVELYGSTPARDFGPLALRAVRERMIGAEMARGTINGHVNRVRHVFRWGAGRELVPASVWQARAAVEALAAGRCAAREPEPVAPVTEREIEATLPHLPAVAVALVRFMLWTGCRPGEAVALRGRELERAGRVWCYRPALHKTAWRGKARAIWIGPQAQAVLAPFLKLDPDAPVFDAADEARERLADRREKRKTPLYPSHVAAQERKRRGLPPGGAALESRPYTEAALRRALNRACAKAGIPPWAPNRLRHACATRYRREVGIEAAALALGHSDAKTTLIYAEASERKAAELAERLG